MAPLYQRVRGQLAALLQQCQQHGIAAPAVQPAALSLGEVATALEVIPDASAIASAKQALAATLGHLAASELFLAASVSGTRHPPYLPCQWKREIDLLQAAVQSILNWQLLGLSMATDLCRQNRTRLSSTTVHNEISLLRRLPGGHGGGGRHAAAQVQHHRPAADGLPAQGGGAGAAVRRRRRPGAPAPAGRRPHTLPQRQVRPALHAPPSRHSLSACSK